MIPNPELKQKISDSYDACWMFGPCDLAFTAIEAAYTHGDAWVDQQLAYLEGNVETVNTFVAEHMPGGYRSQKHEGTFLMWLDRPVLEKNCQS